MTVAATKVTDVMSWHQGHPWHSPKGSLSERPGECHAIDWFCWNIVGPPEWEHEAMSSMVWVQCANLCRGYKLLIAASSVMDTIRCRSHRSINTHDDGMTYKMPYTYMWASDSLAGSRWWCWDDLEDDHSACGVVTRWSHGGSWSRGDRGDILLGRIAKSEMLLEIRDVSSSVF
jgi:hypothetical protein